MDEHDRRPRLVVVALTYRRPGDLEAVLPELVEQALRTGDVEASVLIVDNDPEGAARMRVDEVAESVGRDLVTYAHEPRPGIAAARNRALDVADDHDLLVFIDDDERPSPDWLHHLVSTWRLDRPAGVVGPVVSIYDREPEAWVAAGRFFDRRRLTTGTETAAAATNNLLLDLHQVRRAGLRFDEAFGLSGGSDTLFTRQLTSGGGRLVWCDEAVVTDVVPAARITRRWVLQRAFRSGNSGARTSVTLARGVRERLAARTSQVPPGVIRLVGGVAQHLVGRLTRSLPHQARGARTAARGAGMLTGAFGLVYSEYARPGGSRRRGPRA